MRGGESMENLVGWELDLNVTFCSGKHVAEAQISHAIKQGAKADCISSGRSLLVKETGFNARGKPRGNSGGIETKVIGTASLKQRGEGEAGFPSGRASSA